MDAKVDGVRVTLFGSPRIERDGQPVRFDTRKAVALLAYLAVTQRPHRRDVLASLLWPGSDEVKARSALRRTLSVAGSVGPALKAGRDEVSLNRELLSCDVTDFRRLISRGGLASQQRAIELASDDFLAGFTLRDSPTFDDWQAATSEQLRDQLVAALSQLVAAKATTGELDAALAMTRRWLTVDPMSELAHCQLMRLLSWTDQRPLALQQYRTLTRMLDKELGVPPLPDTIALYDAIRGGRLPPPSPPVTPRPDATVARDTAEPTPVTKPTYLVGRDSERRRLLEAWQASTQTPGLVGVVSEPGLGRSALVDDLAAEVRCRGGTAVVLHAHEGERGLALAGGRDLVRLLSHDSEGDPPDTSALLDSPGAQVRLFESVRQLLERSLVGETPGLLVIDDAQWLDPTSADLLAYVVRRMPPGLLVVVTWRAGVGSTILARLTLDEGEVLGLAGLTTSAVEELLREAGVTDLAAEDVHRRTAGVPRLVLEHVAAANTGAAAARPIRDLMSARLDAASATARQLLSAAAVLGVVVDPELLRSTAGRAELESVDALEEAVSRGLLVELADRRGYDFPHDLLRNIALERTSLARQQLLHGRAADVLIRRHSADPATWRAAVVARHLAAAGRRDEAAMWYWTAAAESRSLYAHREELDQLRSAEAAGFEPATIHEASGDALTRLGRYRDALVAYEQAAAATEDGLTAAVLEHKLANVHDRLGDWPIAQAHLESAQQLLASEGPLELRARVAADLALVLHRQGCSERALTRAQAAADWAATSQDTLALAQSHNVLGVLATGRGDLVLATEHLEQSLARAEGLPDVGPAVAAANNLARAYEMTGRDEAAMRSAEHAFALGVRQGDRHRVAALHTNLADLLHRRGREEEAREHARAAAESFADVDDADARPQVWTLVEW
ncbi:MAG TPA: BTAD domain-containing putative transcriptional regulator [Actinomycetes bacterium]|nr:BTAD domain-containing putative transcriptional regulator [Actinomycetes bacterium]